LLTLAGAIYGFANGETGYAFFRLFGFNLQAILLLILAQVIKKVENGKTPPGMRGVFSLTPL